mmetsp:Transcript_20030/g.62751  ORF Transcript_20030/g.62751 Transcript_20030/m.62751 type:complete len:388 (+) Transcript_20030:1-1164(+)
MARRETGGPRGGRRVHRVRRVARGRVLQERRLAGDAGRGEARKEGLRRRRRRRRRRAEVESPARARGGAVARRRAGDLRRHDRRRLRAPMDGPRCRAARGPHPQSITRAADAHSAVGRNGGAGRGRLERGRPHDQTPRDHRRESRTHARVKERRLDEDDRRVLGVPPDASRALHQRRDAGHRAARRARETDAGPLPAPEGQVRTVSGESLREKSRLLGPDRHLARPQPTSGPGGRALLCGHDDDVPRTSPQSQPRKDAAVSGQRPQDVARRELRGETRGRRRRRAAIRRRGGRRPQEVVKIWRPEPRRARFTSGRRRRAPHAGRRRRAVQPPAVSPQTVHHGAFRQGAAVADVPLQRVRLRAVQRGLRRRRDEHAPAPDGRGARGSP